MEELTYSQQTALGKAMHYCAYRERAHSEVRQKLLKLGLNGDELEEVLTRLILDGFLNEERFARIFVHDKFNLKQWGRLRIVRSLEQLQITPALITTALTELEDMDYEGTLQKVLKKKMSEIGPMKAFEKKGRMARYAISRGFEPELVWKHIARLVPDS